MLASAQAQCLDWKPGFDSIGAPGAINAYAVFDDGSGPALDAGYADEGSFPLEGGVVKWDGETWTKVPGLTGFYVATLIAFDDGSGPALYAGGEIAVDGNPAAECIAKWNGTSWSVPGNGLQKEDDPASVYALAVYDDGSGAALYAGGFFDFSGPLTYVPYIARWNGTSWSRVGVGNDRLNADVYALTMFDDGGGEPVLVVGGVFDEVGTLDVNRIAQWNGTSWSAFGTGTGAQQDVVSALLTFDDGSGPALFAGGDFSTVGANAASNVAKWNGTSWSALGSGTDEYVEWFTTFDDGGGDALYATGAFLNAGGASAPYVAKWNGSSWSSPAFASGSLGTNIYVDGAIGFDDGSGSALFVGGNFAAVDGVPLFYAAKYQASVWNPIPAAGSGLKASVQALTTFDDGSGTALYAGGTSRMWTGNPARWNGTSWTPVTGLSVAQITSLTVADDGSGAALFAGGQFYIASQPRNIARYDGASWTSLGTGTNALVYAIAGFDDGSGGAVYAAGAFSTAGGGSANRIAKWNGTSWSALGTGMNGGAVTALAVFDDGLGDALYAGGNFTVAGGSTANRIAKWNGTSWSALGLGMQGNGGLTIVRALAVFDDGTGAALYAAGLFATADGVTVNHVARWNGSSWSALGTGFDGLAYALYVFDDGSGPALFAGGTFTTAGGGSASRVAKWNGSTWTPLGAGVDGGDQPALGAFSAFDESPLGNDDLFLGGSFTNAGALDSDYVAVWLGCGPGVPYCFGDGLDPVVTAQCPCTNFGEPGHGCANSQFVSGGLLTATGVTSPNTVVFTMSRVPNNALATGFSNVSNTNPGGVVFGDGVRCQSGALVRFGSHNTGTLGDVPNTWSAPAFPIAPGLTRYYQVQYRNPAPGFCPPGTFNITNGYRIVW